MQLRREHECNSEKMIPNDSNSHSSLARTASPAMWCINLGPRRALPALTTSNCPARQTHNCGMCKQTCCHCSCSNNPCLCPVRHVSSSLQSEALNMLPAMKLVSYFRTIAPSRRVGSGIPQGFRGGVDEDDGDDKIGTIAWGFNLYTISSYLTNAALRPCHVMLWCFTRGPNWNFAIA